MTTAVHLQINQPTQLRAAYVRRPHGLNGELRVEVLGDDPHRFQVGLTLSDENSDKQFTVKNSRVLPDRDVLLTFVEVSSRTEAELMRGAYLCVDVTEAPELAEDQWFVYQLIGLEVRDDDGKTIGTVEDVEHYPTQDILVISNQLLTHRIPFVKELVHEVSIPTRTIRATLISDVQS